MRNPHECLWVCAFDLSILSVSPNRVRKSIYFGIELNNILGPCSAKSCIYFIHFNHLRLRVYIFHFGIELYYISTLITRKHQFELLLCPIWLPFIYSTVLYTSAKIYAHILYNSLTEIINAHHCQYWHVD